jgi:hypothetical protein
MQGAGNREVWCAYLHCVACFEGSKAGSEAVGGAAADAAVAAGCGTLHCCSSHQRLRAVDPLVPNLR